MARFERYQSSFVSGVLSPKLRAAIDFDRFLRAAEEIRNGVVLPYGGVTKRPGIRFVEHPRSTVSANSRLIPFQFSTTQAYIIEATGDTSGGWFRFYTQGARLESGGSPVEVTTPYTDSMIPYIRWAQSADILFLAHPDVRPKELRRLSATSFSLVDHVFKDGPYLDVNTTSTTIQASATSGSVTITASSTTGINDNQGFLSTDVGRLIRIKNRSGGGWTWYEITAVNSTTQVTATVKGDNADSTVATTDWRLGAWSDTTGWPSFVAFHAGRLWWARTDTQPQTVWSSRVGQFDNYAPSDNQGTVADDDGIAATANTDQVNEVRWMMSLQRGLLLGSAGAELLVRPADSTNGISPTNIEIVRQSGRGSANTQPVLVGTTPVFVRRDGVETLMLQYDFGADAYITSSLSLLAEHVGRDAGGVRRIIYQQAPYSVIWAVLADNSLAGITIEIEQKVLAWHTHGTDNASAGAGYDSVDFIDAGVIPNGTEDQVWFLVRYWSKPGGTPVETWAIAYLDRFFEAADTTSAFFVDLGLSATFGSPVTSVSGLDHLKGLTVRVLADGAEHPDKTVDDTGTITLDRQATTVAVGLPYRTRLVTLPYDTPDTVGKIRRLWRAHFNLLKTVGLKAGVKQALHYTSKLDEEPFRKPADPMDAPVPPFTGVKTMILEGALANEGQLVVEHDWALPFHLLGVMLDYELVS